MTEVFKAIREEESAPTEENITPPAPPVPPENKGDDDEDWDGGSPAPRGGKAKKIIIIVAIVLAVLAAAMAGGGIVVRGTDAIFPKTTLGGVNVGGLTRAQAEAALADSDWGKDAKKNVTIELPAGCEAVINAGKSGAVPDAGSAATAAYRYGRDCNVFSSLFKYLKGLMVKTDISADIIKLDEDYVKGEIKKAVSEMNELLSGESFEIDLEEEILTVVKGSSAIEVDESAIYELAESALLSRNFGAVEYNYTAGAAEELDVKALHELVFAEAKNAEYDTEAGEVTESVTGVDFDLDEATRLWNAAEVGDIVEIPLTIEEPEYTTETLSEMLFADKLGTQTTYFKSSSANRINNMKLACQKIDGVILNPGDEFSYNGVVGQRTEAAGFKKAGAYANGEVVQEVGGGICQVSSTLYCSALYANLKITSRTCHYFPVDYLPAGLDATVSWKSPDFKFKNDRDFPIKIVANFDEKAKSLTIEIWGSDIDGSYVEMKYSSWKFYDKEYPDVAIGYKATTYRNVFDKDGNLISNEKEASSTYNYHKENIVYPTPTPTATPKPSETPVGSVPPSSQTDVTPPPATATPDPTIPVGDGDYSHSSGGSQMP